MSSTSRAAVLLDSTLRRPISAKVFGGRMTTSKCHRAAIAPGRRLHSTRALQPLSRCRHALDRSLSFPRMVWAIRYSSNTANTSDEAAATAPRGLSSPDTTATDSSAADRRQVPSYDATFTCKPCLTRSTHRISKQGYHKGTVIVTCPQCKNRHLVSDHLKIFSDARMTIDKYLEEHGEIVRRGTLGPDGDIEIWDPQTEDPTVGDHVGAPYKEGQSPVKVGS